MKRNLTKLLCVLLALVMLAGFLPLGQTAHAAYTYTLKGATAHSEGVTYSDFNGGEWGPNLGNSLSPVWKDGNAPPSGSIKVSSFHFFENSDFHGRYTVEPQPGDVCYSYVYIYNADKDDHSVDYTQVTAENVEFTIPGYTVEVTAITLRTVLQADGVSISYKATKNTGAASYTVKFMDGDTELKSVTVNNGEKLDYYDPGKSGYGLFGWYTDKALTTKYDFTQPVTGSFSLYAKLLPELVGLEVNAGMIAKNGANYRLTPRTMTPKFHADAAPVTLDTLTMSDLYTDAALTSPLTTPPVRGSSYYFSVNMGAGSDESPKVFFGDGLKTGSTVTAGNGVISFGPVEYVELFRSPNSGSALVVFKFTKETVTVTYDPNGGTPGVDFVDTAEAEYGSSAAGVCEAVGEFVIIPPAGMEYDGWQIGDKIYHVGDPIQVVYDRDLTFKYLWKAKTSDPLIRTITWKPGEGTGTEIVETAAEGASITVKTFPDGWTEPGNRHFAGWTVTDGNVTNEPLHMGHVGYSRKVAGDSVFIAYYQNWVSGWEDTGAGGVDLEKLGGWGCSVGELGLPKTGNPVYVAPNSASYAAVYMKDGYRLKDDQMQLIAADGTTVLATVPMTWNAEGKYYSGNFTMPAEDVSLRFASVKDGPVTYSVKITGGYRYGTDETAFTAKENDTFSIHADVAAIPDGKYISAFSDEAHGFSVTHPLITMPGHDLDLKAVYKEQEERVIDLSAGEAVISASLGHECPFIDSTGNNPFYRPVGTELDINADGTPDIKITKLDDESGTVTLTSLHSGGPDMIQSLPGYQYYFVYRFGAAPVICTVTWKAGEGTGTEIVETAEDGTQITVKPFPSAWTPPDNRHFAGWAYTSGSGVEGVYNAWQINADTKHTLAGNTTFTAFYRNLILGWEDTGAGGVNTEALGSGCGIGEIGLPKAGVVYVEPNSDSYATVFLKEGYRLEDDQIQLIGADGTTVLATVPMTWIEGYNYYTGDFTMPAEDVSLRFASVKAAPASYTVSFNSNSGDGSMADIVVPAGEKLTLPACGFTPPSDDKEFDRWDAGKPGEQVDIISDCTITAIWKYKAVAPKTVAGISITTPGKTAYTVGNALDVSGMTIKVEYSDGSSATIPVTAAMVSGFDSSAPTTSQTLTITYEGKSTTYDVSISAAAPVTYNITVNAGAHGTASTSAVSVTAGTTITVTATANSGYELDKISYTPDGGSETDITSTKRFTMPAAKVTVNVSFKASSVTPPGPTTYTVTFRDGESVFSTATVNGGERLAKPADPAKTGYTFNGWYTDAAFTTAFDFNQPITANTAVFAKFTENSVTPPSTITYTVTGGSDSSWTKGSSATLTITVKRSEADDTCFSHFTGVEIDGTALAASDYEAKSGSTVVTIKASALQKLSKGTHTVTVKFDDGMISTGLTVKAGSGSADKPTSPKSGDESVLALWLVMIIVTLQGMVLVLPGIRQAKPQKRSR